MRTIKLHARLRSKRINGLLLTVGLIDGPFRRGFPILNPFVKTGTLVSHHSLVLDTLRSPTPAVKCYLSNPPHPSSSRSPLRRHYIYVCTILSQSLSPAWLNIVKVIHIQIGFATFGNDPWKTVTKWRRYVRIHTLYTISLLSLWTHNTVYTQLYYDVVCDSILLCIHKIV